MIKVVFIFIISQLLVACAVIPDMPGPIGIPGV
jgi:hypothetical protein